MRKRFHLDNLYSAVRITHFHNAKVLPGWSYGDQRHTNLEFKYCATGSLRMWIDGESYDLHPGDAVVIKPGQYHRTEPVKVESEFFVFHFDVESEQVHAAFQLLGDPLLRPGVGEDERLIPMWVDRFLAEYGDKLQVYPSNNGQASGGDIDEALFLLLLQSRLLEFISMLGSFIIRRGGRTDTVQAQPAQLNIAREAAYWMEVNLPKEMRIGELSQRLGIHRSYLCDCFKRVYGMSPRMYLNMLRIREAKFLLQDTPYTVEDISERLHFSSSAHFCRFFRQMTGTSPGRYRNK